MSRMRILHIDRRQGAFMRPVRYAFALVGLCAAVASLPGIAEQKPTELDFEFFKNEVQPMFLVKRQGNVACASCHAGAASSGFRLQPLKDGALYWDEEQ